MMHAWAGATSPSGRRHVLFCLLLAAFRAENPAVAIIEWQSGSS